MDELELTPEDLRFLAARGIAAEAAARQLSLLRNPPSPPRILRPCTLGDGIGSLAKEEHDELEGLWREAATGGRVSKFVPASGAATRMFADLVSTKAAGDGDAAAVFCERRGEFAFAAALEDALEASGAEGAEAVVRTLVARPGLGYGDLPKALIAFHAYAEGPRSAFAEQLVEAAGYAATPQSPVVRAHFTVTPSHEPLFSDLLEQAREKLESVCGARLAVSFSTQDPATDTLCVDDAGRPVRDARGELLLRPAGHGALLGNLQACAGDLVVVKNIDNIQPEHRQAEVVRWKRLLIGLTVRLERELAAVERRLAAGETRVDETGEALAAILGLETPGAGLAEWIEARLHRPLRVCGMVRNEGEPGGGPFWVETRDGTGASTLQIVEAAQIDSDDRKAAEILASATHFNPVDLVCSLRDRRGEAHDLEPLADPTTAFVSRKEHAGRGLRALERPGLWNGAMAGWNTIFVEVPAATFAPVKTVLDLLRPEHQPPAGGPTASRPG